MGVPDCIIEIMQDILNKVNESQRELFLLPTWLTGKIEAVS